MTEQYAQSGVNPLDATPYAVQTLDLAAILVDLGSLTEDGSSLIVDIFGGGSDPAAPSTNNYTTSLRATFTREAGVIALGAQNIAIDFTGAAVVLGFAVDVPSATAQLSIATALATPYNHRLKVVRNVF